MTINRNLHPESTMLVSAVVTKSDTKHDTDDIELGIENCYHASGPIALLNITIPDPCGDDDVSDYWLQLGKQQATELHEVLGEFLELLG